MRTLALVPILLAAVAASAQAPAPDPMLRAMHDEMERSLQLKVPDLQSPYFVEYLIDQADNFGVTASLGGLLSRRADHFRSPEVRVRVGDYQFDNTNFAGGFFGRARYDVGSFPIENSYSAMRRYLWLATDSAYKTSVETLSRKHAALRNLSVSEQLADFAHEQPVHLLRPLAEEKIDQDAWSNRVRKLSAVFDKFPDVKASSVELESSQGGFYLVNSEGTEVRAPESIVYVRARASAQAPDGMVVRDAATFLSPDAAHLPSEAEMTRGVADLAQAVTALAHAPKGEDYSGPVLFEGEAGAQLFAQTLGENLALTRRPVGGGGRGGGFQPSELEGRIGARVLPESFTVVDDPTQKEWHGQMLTGGYEVDREGVIPQPLHLVEKGVLKGYLLTRQPMRGFSASNGRARLPGAFGVSGADFSNLFVTSSETVPVAELKKKLIEMCQARDKPYGIIVKRMDFPSSASVQEVRQILTGEQTSSAHPVSLPIMVYKLYPDGREELVRGVRFRGLNTRSLKDIMAAGDDSAVFAFEDNRAPFALMGASNYSVETSVVAPSVLIDDLELHPVEEELPKLPVVPAPELLP
ncbi:MAG TPA: metallopeptidase TldD-related protein [Bryobacteraceae bacterium]|nr:metallopeptidase TldD-related protein [Bryobacteraceae bacterium]